MPDFPIIDTHVHLYDIARLQYDWLRDVPPINHSHLVADLDAATGPMKLKGFVFVEVAANAGQHLAEAAFAQGIADIEPRLGAIIAHAPVQIGAAVCADLEALLAYKKVRGIRRLIQGEVDPSICLEPLFIEGVRRLAHYNLTFDLCLKHWAMPYAIELAKKCPDVTFVLDHIGKPDIRHGLRQPWWSQITEMARLPNVVCKISGAIGEADPKLWTADQVKPYVAHAIECFGFERSMFGSDWPVSALTHQYEQWVDLVDSVAAGATMAEKHQLYCGTAQRIYRLQPNHSA